MTFNTYLAQKYPEPHYKFERYQRLQALFHEKVRKEELAKLKKELKSVKNGREQQELRDKIEELEKKDPRKNKRFMDTSAIDVHIFFSDVKKVQKKPSNFTLAQLAT
jgi:hypothetical protein